MEEFDETFQMLEDLTEEELLALDAEFDPSDDFRPASERKAEENKGRKFEKRDMVESLEQIIRKNQVFSMPDPKPPTQKPTTTPYSKSNNRPTSRKLQQSSLSSSSTYSSPSTDYNNNSSTSSSYRKSLSPSLTSPGSDRTSSSSSSSSKRDYVFSEDEDDLFGQLTEEELMELAALTNTHGLLTQEETHRFQDGGDRKFDFEPVKTPSRILSMSDDDADLDTVLLMDCLRTDSDELYHVRINNIKLEKAVMYAIFDALKTTQVIKHLSLAAVTMKDEDGLLFNEAMKENKTIETLNLESNELTNICIEPLCEILQTHPTVREFKCSHQTHGLGSRGEEAMAKALSKNDRLLKISYPFKVQSARSTADRCQIRNNEILRQKRSKGEDFYNYRQEIEKRDKHVQPWIRARDVNKNEKMKADLAEQKGRMKNVPCVSKMRAEAKLRAKENAKPTIDGELAQKLKSARLSRGRSISSKD